MFVLLVFFLLDTSVTSAEECPEEKRVGDICYTKVAMAPTHQYGCIENCTYKKTDSSDTGLYCFKTGSLQVTECGGGFIDSHKCSKDEYLCGSGNCVPSCSVCGTTKAQCQGTSTTSACYLMDGQCVPRLGPLLIGYTPSDVKCGSGVKAPVCPDCGTTKPLCQGVSVNSDCVLQNGTCVPRRTVLDFGIFLDSFDEAFTKFETNTTDSGALDWSEDGFCWPWDIIKCMKEIGSVFWDCKHCNVDVDCWIGCLREKICTIASKCRPGKSCWIGAVIDVIKKLLDTIFGSQIVDKIIQEIEGIIC